MGVLDDSILYWEDIEREFSEGDTAWTLFETKTGGFVNDNFTDLAGEIGKKVIWLFLRKSDAQDWLVEHIGVDHPFNKDRTIQAHEVSIFECKRLIDEQTDASKYELVLIAPNAIHAITSNTQSEGEADETSKSGKK